MLLKYRTRLIATIAALSCLFAVSLANAKDVKWNKDIKKAAQQSASQKKPMMVMVSS